MTRALDYVKSHPKLIMGGLLAVGAVLAVSKVRQMSKPPEEGGCAGCARRKAKLQAAGLWPTTTTGNEAA